MTPIAKAIAVALVHVLIVLSLGGKLLYDRSHRPRVWVRTSWIDPELPIRGRYFTLSLPVNAPWFRPSTNSSVTLGVEHGTLSAYKSESNTGLSISNRAGREGQPFLDQPVTFFVPERAQFPALERGDELWAEVTVPRSGPPRPIQLALKRGGDWKPLSYLASPTIPAPPHSFFPASRVSL
jgi:hypothetical protein